jgi:hypothetical protein
MKYTIVHLENKKQDMSEKTFCFACGCFQGSGLPGARG